MEILFLVPPAGLNAKKLPVDRIYGCNYGFDYKPPIHLLVLATIAKQLGHGVRLLDCPAEGYNLRRFLDYIKNNNSADLAVFFTVWLSKKEDLSAAEIINNQPRHARIVFTGPYPTWKPELFLKNKDYFVIRGEPEDAFKELLEKISCKDGYFHESKGLSFLDNGVLVDNPYRGLLDIDYLPVPDRSLLKGSYIFNRIKRCPATAMCVSRGCSYRCTYCAPHALDQAIELEHSRSGLEKPPLRLKKVESVVREFKEIAVLGYKGVEICDNQFTWDNARTKEICSAIELLKLDWICYARADHLNDQGALQLMKSAGCKLVYIGSESFNQVILNDIGKEMSKEDIHRAVGLLKDCDIEPEVSVLFGASGLESRETIKQSIREAKGLGSEFIHYGIASPLPNTRLYKTAKEKGWLKAGDFIPTDNVRGALLDLPNIKADRLEKIIRECYAWQYLSFRFIFKQIAGPCFFKRLISRIKVLAKLILYLLFTR